MKVVISSALVGLAYAGFDHMADDYETLARSTVGERAFTDLGAIGQSIQNLNFYGCWCYFDDDHGRGKSRPVDDVDSLCKTLHDGYECAIADAEEAGNSCVPWEVSYTSIVGSTANLDLSFLERCAAVNPDNDCATWACTVEGSFVENAFALIISGDAVDNDKKHSNDFDTDANCPINKGTPGEKACCGEFPTRFPFKTLDGDRSCCGGRTFNTLTLKCCPGDRVKFNC